MANFDSWDWGLYALAGYVAVVGLVRLMLAHRERTLAQLRREMELGARRSAAAEGLAAMARDKAA